METLRRYGRLYKVFVAQFFKYLVQSKADFLIIWIFLYSGNRYCIFVFGIPTDSEFGGLDVAAVDLYLWFCADTEGTGSPVYG